MALLPQGSGGGGGGLADAPSDDKAYSRRNGAWERVPFYSENLTDTVLNMFINPSTLDSDITANLNYVWGKLGFLDLLSRPDLVSTMLSNINAFKAISSNALALRFLSDNTAVLNQFKSSSTLTSVSSPNMTGSTTPSGDVSAKNSYGSGYEAWRGMSNAADYWCSLTDQTSTWFKYVFNDPVFIHTAELIGSESTTLIDFFTWQYSDDNVTWTNVPLSGSLLPYTSNSKHFWFFRLHGKHRYWRVSINTVIPGYHALNEVKLSGFTW